MEVRGERVGACGGEAAGGNDLVNVPVVEVFDVGAELGVGDVGAGGEGAAGPLRRGARSESEAASIRLANSSRSSPVSVAVCDWWSTRTRSPAQVTRTAARSTATDWMSARVVMTADPNRIVSEVVVPPRACEPTQTARGACGVQTGGPWLGL
ncbi:hypothetical protein BJP07_06855 [Corynebacterium sp. NML130628]|nr:hypothetical protein BJP07_06855 [Corynebacterium sp. NML130628]